MDKIPVSTAHMKCPAWWLSGGGAVFCIQESPGLKPTAGRFCEYVLLSPKRREKLEALLFLYLYVSAANFFLKQNCFLLHIFIYSHFVHGLFNLVHIFGKF